MIHRGRPGKGARGSSEDRHFWTEGKEESDAPGRPEAFFECFAYFTFFFEIFEKKIFANWTSGGEGIDLKRRNLDKGR